MNNDKNEGGRRRHCMVVHAYYPLGETRVERQAQALRQQGVDVDIICLCGSNKPGLSTVDGVQVHRLPVRRHKGKGNVVQLLEYLNFFVLAFFKLWGLYKRRHYNVIQVHNLPDFLVFVAVVPKLRGAKVILDLHDLMPEFYAERFQRSLDSLPVRLVRWQEALSCHFADHVITVTEYWRQTLIKRGQPADKVSVVMNVADDRIFHRNVRPMTSDDERFCLIYHGNLDRRYGLDLILLAINQIRETVPDIRLLLHGGGGYRETLERMAVELELQEYVEFSTRFLPTSELPELLKQANLAVVPYREGVFTSGILPTKLMEYTALGIPAIVARSPVIEAYFDDTMVEFFEPSDVDGLVQGIHELYDNPDRLRELVQGSETFNQRYNWTQISADYVALVERLSLVD